MKKKYKNELIKFVSLYLVVVILILILLDCFSTLLVIKTPNVKESNSLITNLWKTRGLFLGSLIFWGSEFLFFSIAYYTLTKINYNRKIDKILVIIFLFSSLIYICLFLSAVSNNLSIYILTR